MSFDHTQPICLLIIGIVCLVCVFTTVVGILYLNWLTTPIIQRIQNDSLPATVLEEFSVDTLQFADSSITYMQFNTSSISENKFVDRSVTHHKLLAEAVREHHIGANAVTTNKIQDGAVTSTKIANNSLNVQHILNGSVNGFVFENGTISTLQMAQNAISTSKLANNTISTQNLANNSVSLNKLKNHTITEERFSTDVFTQVNTSIVDKLESFAICLGTCPTYGLCQPATYDDSYVCNCQGSRMYDGSFCVQGTPLNLTGIPWVPVSSCSIRTNGFDNLGPNDPKMSGYLFNYTFPVEQDVKITFRCSEGGYKTFQPYIAVYENSVAPYKISDPADFSSCTYTRIVAIAGGDESNGDTNCQNAPEVTIQTKGEALYIFVGTYYSLQPPIFPFRLMVESL